jgi:hypothetical protein
MMKDDVEAGVNEPLLVEKKEEKIPDDPPYPAPPSDLKEAAFWLFMLFLASVTMTVGNKVGKVLVWLETA